MSAQVSKVFLYEIKLYEQYRHPAMWGDRENAIQKSHIEYLDSLTNSGKLKIAGIIDQGLEDHVGFILLTVENYEEAEAIALYDPSVRQGMMTARVRPINVYFEETR